MTASRIQLEETTVEATPLSSENSTMAALATTEPSAGTKPIFKIVIAGEDWTFGFLFGSCTLNSVNSNGQFQLMFDLRAVGKVDENDAITAGSPLDKITQLRKEPFRDIVELYCGYDEVADTLFFTGLLDRIEVVIVDDMVTLTGRDRSAMLQDGFTHRQLRNASAKDILESIAKKYGLTLDTKLDSGAKLGEIFEDEKYAKENIPSSGWNDWELLTKLADRLSYSTYVDGDKLVFQPYEEATDTIEFALGKNIANLTMIRNFNVDEARIKVEFVSVDQQTKKTEVISVGGGGGKAQPGEQAVYRMPVLPNTPPDALERMAQAFVRAAVQTEAMVIIESVGHPSQSLRKKIRLSGTQTSFDQDYRIASIAWQFGFEHGWTASFDCFKIPPGFDAVGKPGERTTPEEESATTSDPFGGVTGGGSSQAPPADSTQ